MRPDLTIFGEVPACLAHQPHGRGFVGLSCQSFQKLGCVLLGGAFGGGLHQKRFHLDSVVSSGGRNTCKHHALPRSSPGSRCWSVIGMQTAELLLKTCACTKFVLCCLALLCPFQQ